MGNALFFPGSFPIGEGVSEKYDICHKHDLVFTNLDLCQSNQCQLLGKRLLVPLLLRKSLNIMNYK